VIEAAPVNHRAGHYRQLTEVVLLLLLFLLNDITGQLKKSVVMKTTDSHKKRISVMM
jgi:hypothetical protein